MVPSFASDARRWRGSSRRPNAGFKETMSYTLNNLKAARKALIDDNVPRAIYHINLLIERMEKILSGRKAYKPKCKELQDVNNGSTESGAEEPLGQQRHTGDNGLLPMGERLRHLAPKDGARGAEGEKIEEHHSR